MIEVTGLKKRYGDFEAVKGVTFTVRTGSIVGLLGPNGAGKTTIMKALTGYHWPSEGSTVLNGVDVQENPVEAKRLVGYLPESVPLYTDMTVKSYLAFVAEARDIPPAERKAAIARASAACGVSDMMEVPIERLSKGYRQRVGLAQAIVHDPAILILDEPTTGLDPNQILEIRVLIRKLGEAKTVILSTHILQEVEALCSQVLILNDGRIVAQGSPDEIAESMKGEERVECLLSVPAGLSAEAVASALGAIVDVRHAEASGDRHGYVRAALRVGSGSGDESAAAVFDWAVSSGCRILELRRERLSLEEIFVKLTREEAKA